MSDTVNPYASTQVDMDGKKPPVPQGIITETMVGYLKEASPWIRFIAILGFVGSGFIILAGVIVAFAAPFLTAMEDNDNLRMFAGFAGAGFGIFYAGIGVLYIIPCRFLYNFGTKIRSYTQTNNEQALEIALKNNKSFWKFCGIVGIVSLALVPVLMVISVIIAITGSLM